MDNGKRVRPSGLTATTFEWVQYLKSFRGGDTEPERGLEYGRVVAKYVIHSNTQEEIRRHREPYPETLFNLSRFVTYVRTNTGDGKKVLHGLSILFYFLQNTGTSS